jgi:anti-anti-sigma regulatory factor
MNKKIISLPQRLDESSKFFFQGLEILEDDIVLDFSSVRYFDFVGAQLLLDFIKTEIIKTQLSFYVPQPKLAALLRFMQFYPLTSFLNQLHKEA